MRSKNCLANILSIFKNFEDLKTAFFRHIEEFNCCVAMTKMQESIHEILKFLTFIDIEYEWEGIDICVNLIEKGVSFKLRDSCIHVPFGTTELMIITAISYNS